jgi:hypothetical protein
MWSTSTLKAGNMLTFVKSGTRRTEGVMMCKRFVNWKETLVTLDQGYLTSIVSSYDDIEGSF